MGQRATNTPTTSAWAASASKLVITVSNLRMLWSLWCRIIPARLTYDLLRFVAILLQTIMHAEFAIV